MRYEELLTKVFPNANVGAKTSAPTIDETVASAIKDAAREAIQEIIPPPQPVMVDQDALGKLIDDAVAKHVPTQVEAKPDMELNDKVNTMMQLMKELAERDNSAPANYDSYALNDDEIANVLTWLLEFQEKYFPTTPLSETLHQDFMWNIPHEVYNAAVDARAYEYPDVLNPIFWLYICCTESPHDMIGEFVINAINSIDDDGERILSEHASAYKKAYFESEDDTEDITSEELYSISVDGPQDGVVCATNPTPLTDTAVSSIEDFDPEVEIEVVE